MTASTPRAATVLLAATITATAAFPGLAQQQSRYGSWGQGGDMQQLLDELRALVDEADRARAADPRFLRDLRDLGARYAGAAQVGVLRDDFADGDFTRSPAWTVTSGSFRVERGYGLLSETQSTAGAPAAGGSGDAGKDLAAALIGGLLSQYAQQGQGQPQQPAAGVDEPARIETRARIGNAFTVDATVSSEAGSDRLELTLFQGHGNGPAYSLVFSPNRGAPLELLRAGSRGSNLVASYRQPLAASGEATHRLSWTRTPSGEMVVSLEGREVLRAVDTGLRDPFDGLAITNHGGRFLIREVSVAAAG